MLASLSKDETESFPNLQHTVLDETISTLYVRDSLFSIPSFNACCIFINL